jgi:hypothetical protein
LKPSFYWSPNLRHLGKNYAIVNLNSFAKRRLQNHTFGRKDSCGFSFMLFFTEALLPSQRVMYRVGNKKPTQKNPPKKTHPKKPNKKNPQKMFTFGLLNFLFFMKIIQTFLFETDFL